MAKNRTAEELSFFDMMYREIGRNFIDCNETVLQKPYPNDGDVYCNATFDGYSCWDYAKAGTRTYGTCPRFFIYKFGQHFELPFKDCNSDGTWYRHPDTQNAWTDYSPCTNTVKVQRAKSVLYVYFSGYSISIVSLLLALFIFTCYRQLKCTRVTIHKHLFLSYIITAVMWVLYYAATSFNPAVIINNPVWCKLLHVLAQHVTVCNYAWMFCEGLYLHTILVRTFSSEKILLRVCYVIGWGVPILPSVLYTILRATYAKIDIGCWHSDTLLKWIFSGPIALSLAVNVFFLINILRILCSKVITMNSQESNPLRQSLRATLILIPLLGIQYFVLPFRPNADEEDDGHYVYDMASACLASFQGFLVSLLFCFLNGEVLFLLKTQVVVVRRRMSRTETGKSFIYSAVQQADEKANRRRSVQLANQKIHCKSPDTIPQCDIEGRKSSMDQDITHV